jgi:HAD superfamily hydrolase (TIGR01509 family)
MAPFITWNSGRLQERNWIKGPVGSSPGNWSLTRAFSPTTSNLKKVFETNSLSNSKSNPPEAGKSGFLFQGGPMNRAAAVIFDCDGVMFDSRQANIHFYNHLLAHFGLPPMNHEESAFVHMHTASESTSYIFKGSPHGEEADDYRIHMDYTPFIEDMIIEPGLVELLGRLKGHCKLALATNRSNTIDLVLERYELTAYFDMVVSSLDVDHPKPHPESLEKILDRFGLSPEQGVYIGDSEIDEQTAAAAEVPFMAYKNRELTAAYYAESMREVAFLLGFFQ